MKSVIIVLKDGKPFKVYPNTMPKTAIKVASNMNKYYKENNKPERFTVEEIEMEVR